MPGAALAAELGISLRTLYRDVSTLRDQGARIDGDPGVGYQLRGGFLLQLLELLVGADLGDALLGTFELVNACLLLAGDCLGGIVFCAGFAQSSGFPLRAKQPRPTA